MVKKTNFLLFSLIAALIVSPAYSVTVSKTYVDKQDKSLQSNILLLRDMLNTKDSSGAWLTLDTDAQLAIPAINELKAALDTKANADDVLTADSLTTLNEAITALQTGKADASTVTDIQTAIDNLGDTYATDDDVSAAIAGVQSAIDNIDLSAYAKIADLAAVATSGQYADLEGKPEIPSIAGLATEQALTNLQTTLEAAIAEKQDAGEYLVAADLTTLNDAITALQTGKADKSTVETIQTTINNLGNTYATKSDMTTADAELRAAIEAINVPSLEGYVKSSDLAVVATSGQYADLEGKPEIPSIAGLATEQALTNLQTTLTGLINAKQDAGEYLVAADLNVLNNQVSTLQTGKADVATVAEIQTTLSKLGETYATDAELTAAIDAVKLLIPTIPTNVSAFTNDAGYITENDLTPYAKSADAEMLANKVSDATAEQIEAMSSSEKATKYPSIAVSQTIANAAVTKVNEVAGDLSTLQTQVETNTADIAELDDTVDKVSVIAYAAIPAPSEACKAVSGACALSSDTNGNLTWVMIANSLTDVQ